jgi:hypothetical protein
MALSAAEKQAGGAIPVPWVQLMCCAVTSLWIDTLDFADPLIENMFVLW